MADPDDIDALLAELEATIGPVASAPVPVNARTSPAPAQPKAAGRTPPASPEASPAKRGRLSQAAFGAGSAGAAVWAATLPITYFPGVHSANLGLGAAAGAFLALLWRGPK
jgi:hypothetical protein